MEVKQIATLMNTVTKEVIGESAIQTEDLTNIVDIGTQIFDADAVDAYVKSLVNHIGKMVFVNRPYNGSVPSLMMENWEFGSVMEKVQAEMPEAVENESWQLEDGTFYNPYVFHAPEVTAKFYNKRVTFEIEMSFVTEQVKQSFSNASQLNAFISMIETAVSNSLTVKVDELAMKTINEMIGETVKDEFPSGTYTGTGVKAINLLKLYNDKFGTTLEAGDACTNPEFIRFASYEINLYKSRMAKISTLFNIEGKARFTPNDRLHCVMLAEFKNASDVYLQSDVYHNELTALPNGIETVPFWQGSGTEYAFEDTSAINIKTAKGDSIEFNGILAVMFSRDTCGIACQDRRVTTSYNPKAEFYNNFYKFTCGYFCDLAEEFLVFYVA